MTKFPHRNQFMHLAAGAAALGAVILLSANVDREALAQTRTIKILVPFVTGGAASVLAHLLADQISHMQGTTTIVENRPGAGTALATEAVARAAADGNTLLINNPGIVINAHLRKQNYDPLTSFEPICILADAPTFIIVNSASPYHTLTDLLTAARIKPDELTVATFTATGPHIGLEELKRLAKVDLTFVPYPGSAPAVTALLGEHVTAMMDNYATVAEHVKAGKLRVLATLSGARIQALPNIPTVEEAAHIDLAQENWFGLFAPAHTSKETLRPTVQLDDCCIAGGRS